MEENIESTEAVVHMIQMNKWAEELTEGDIEGQAELVPVDGRDYILQMVVSPSGTWTNADKTKYRYTLKRIGAWKLTAVPAPGESLQQKIEALDE